MEAYQSAKTFYRLGSIAPATVDRTRSATVGDSGDAWLLHVEQASAALRAEDLPARERLERAADRFWAAAFYRDQWSDHLRQLGDDVTANILKRGPIQETVAHLSREEMETTELLLLRFIQEVNGQVAAQEKR